MIKPIKGLLCLLALALLAAACSDRQPVDAGLPGSGGAALQGCPMPIYFDSEEQLLSAIREVKSKKGQTDTADEVLIIHSKTANEQGYGVALDIFELADISEFYKPMRIPRGLSFMEIRVNNDYVSYGYAGGDQSKVAAFTWFREMSPDVAMNGLYGRGAVSEREIEHNGIKYVFLEWADSSTGQSAGFGVHWVVEGKAYQASIPSGYTDDEMLEFCRFEAVAAE